MRVALGIEYDGIAFLRLADAAVALRRAGPPRSCAGAHRRRAGRDDRAPGAPTPACTRWSRSSTSIPGAAPGLGVGARRQRVASRRAGGALGAGSRRRIPRALQRAQPLLSLRAAQSPGAACRRPRARRLVPPAARRRAHARGGATPRSASTISARFARASARRARRCASSRSIADRAPRRVCRLRFLAPTLSCITWCATSWARWSTSARASTRRTGSREVLAGRDRARAAPTFDAAGLYLAPRRITTRAWELPQAAAIGRSVLELGAAVSSTGGQDLRHHAHRRRARGRARTARTRSGSCSSAEPALCRRRTRPPRSCGRCRRS